MTDQVRNSPACREPPSRPLLCVTGCGFFGNPRTDNMCSVCHRKTTSVTTATTTVVTTTANNTLSTTTPILPTSTNISSTVPQPTINTNSSNPNNLTISTLTAQNQISNLSQISSPITPIQRAPAPSPFSMSLADPLPDSLSVPFLDPFIEPTNNITSPLSVQQLDSLPASIDSSTSTITLSPINRAIETPVMITPPERFATPGPSKPLKNRCKVCSRKVGLAYFNCKCDEDAMFCTNHRYPHAHSCNYSHLSDQQAKLLKDNPIVKNDQFERL